MEAKNRQVFLSFLRILRKKLDDDEFLMATAVIAAFYEHETFGYESFYDSNFYLDLNRIFREPIKQQIKVNLKRARKKSNIINLQERLERKKVK